MTDKTLYKKLTKKEAQHMRSNLEPHTKMLETPPLHEVPLPPLRILAMGGCMTQGYPLGEKAGFANLIAHETIDGRAVHLSSMALNGFTSVRAEKWSVLRGTKDEHVDYVILQFGSTDASLPLREKLPFQNQSRPSSVSPKTKPTPQKKADQPKLEPEVADFFTYPIWWVESVLRWALRVRPRVESALYAETMSRVVSRLSTKTVPVVLSPFVMGDLYSQASARKHTEALAREMATLPGVVFVNAFGKLCAYPRHRVLLPDGMHLSAFGHQIVARAVSEAISAHIHEKKPQVAA